MMNNLVDALKSSEVVIKYKSILSGNLKEVRGTLLPPHFVPQNPHNDAVVMWDVENERWEDIRVDTIISWIRTSV